MKKSAHYLFGCAACVMAQPAFAQTEQPVAAATATIDDIVVTARRSAEQAQKIPISMTVVTSAMLVDRSVRDVSDITVSTPSFFASTPSADPSALLLALRGQSLADVILTLDSPVGVYVDGVYLPRQVGLRGALIDIQRVEVLKGPQGTLFGKNTTGGAVNITTRQPDLATAGGYADMLLGNYGRMDFTGALNVPLVEDRVAVRMVGQYSGNNGYGRNFVRRRIGGEVANSFRLNATLVPSDRLSIRLSADYQKIDGDGAMVRLAWLNPFPAALGLPAPTALLTATVLQSGQAVTPANLQAAHSFLSQFLIGRGRFYDTGGTTPQRNDFEGYGLSASIDYELSDLFSFKSITANRWAKRNSLVDFDGMPAIIFEPEYLTDSKAFSQEVQLVSDSDKPLSGIVGAYYARETGFERSISITAPPLVPTNPSIGQGDVLNKTIAAFGQVNYQISDTLRATVGIRWTKETKGLVSSNTSGLGCNIPAALRSGAACIAFLRNNYSDHSYVVSLDWTPAEGILAYAKTSRGFKGGGQNIRGQAADARTFAPFRPETVTDYEVGVKADLFDRRLRINAALYHSLFDDIQRNVNILFSTGAIGTVITNAAEGKVDGAELEVIARPFNALLINLSGSYTDASYSNFVDLTGDRTGEPYAIPKWTYAAGATYTAELPGGSLRFIGGWSWRSNVNFRGFALIDRSVTQKRYGLLDGRISWHIDALDLDLAVFGKNLLNKNYITGGVDLDRNLGYNIVNLGTPRLLGIQVRKSFGSR